MVGQIKNYSPEILKTEKPKNAKLESWKTGKHKTGKSKTKIRQP